MNNDNMHVYCPKCGSEVMLADENGNAIMPKAGDFFLRLKDNDPESLNKLKGVIKAMFGNDAEIAKTQERTKDAQVFDGSNEDEIEQSIMENGDICAKPLWRRWIMSQVLRHYKTADGKENFHNYFIKSKTMNYVLKMCLKEAKALYNLSGIDLQEREMFFNLDVFRRIISNYINEYKTEVHKQLEELDLENRKMVFKKGFGSKMLERFSIGKMTYRADDAKLVVHELNGVVEKANSAKSYLEIAVVFDTIIKKFPPFKDCRKSKAWIDAFKGAGAFYTMDNLFRWHHCTIRDENTNKVYSGDGALKYLRDKTKSLPSKEYYKLYAIMKRVVKENHFSFEKRMEELHSGNVA